MVLQKKLKKRSLVRKTREGQNCGVQTTKVAARLSLSEIKSATIKGVNRDRLVGEGALFQPTPPVDLPQPPQVGVQPGPSYSEQNNSAGDFDFNSFSQVKVGTRKSNSTSKKAEDTFVSMNCHNSAQQVKPACLVVSLRDAQARQKCPELCGIRSLDSVFLAEKQEGKPDHGRLTVSHSSSGWERCGFKSLSGFKIGVSLQRAVSSLVCASLFTQGREEIEIGPVSKTKKEFHLVDSSYFFTGITP